MGSEKTYELCRIKDQAISWMNSAIGMGVENIDAKEVGEVADIIKDMCEAEKYLHEACYYEKVVKAMEEEAEDPDNRGYYGYTRPYKPHIDQEPYLREYMNGADMRYANPSSARYYNGPDGMYGNNMSTRNYNGSDMDYGNSNSMRTYTDSEFKPKDGHYKEQHLDNTINLLKEMWEDSDPALRSMMKTELTSLVNTMKV